MELIPSLCYSVRIYGNLYFFRCDNHMAPITRKTTIAIEMVWAQRQNSNYKNRYKGVGWYQMIHWCKLQDQI